jgi:hypothetical protein
MDIESKTVLAAIERLETEKQRRIDEKVEKGEAIREELYAVCAGVEDTADVLERAKASRIAELRAAGEKREIIFDPIDVICTGVPRPGRDDKYIERLDRECAKPEELRQREKEAAAARGIDFHEGSRSHEPEYKPPPMSKAPEEPPAENLEWRGVWVQIRGPDHERNDPGEIAEARYAVLNGSLYVEDAQGQRLGVQELGAGEDAAAVARGIARKKLGGNQFYRPIAYPNLGLV